jgi:hypothetical protein
MEEHKWGGRRGEKGRRDSTDPIMSQVLMSERRWQVERERSKEKELGKGRVSSNGGRSGDSRRDKEKSTLGLLLLL